MSSNRLLQSDITTTKHVNKSAANYQISHLEITLLDSTHYFCYQSDISSKHAAVAKKAHVFL